jgi:hypothetical protein
LIQIGQAFRAFFALLFGGTLPPDLIAELGLAPKAAPVPVATPKPEVKPEDGALQLLGILQRDARILDFFMEDISPYSDEQVGAASATYRLRASRERAFSGTEAGAPPP